ncbi:MAG: hypothetical protein PHD61_06460 [Bacteroidales bacterium]|nr:hypothetical protein [Lentimicrobiaceae bacterium]MDD5694931.1 hypothetical protein [Bacteroidales bacterium]
MANKKKLIYQKYIGQFEETIVKGYYFEAAWLEYVLLEDRLVSLLQSSGGEYKPNGKPILMMGPKIDELNSRMAENQVLKGHLEVDDLINRLQIWKNERNTLMHSMADGSLSITEIESKIKHLAKTGTKLTRDYASAAKRVKKHRNK